jgi:hypothetical protein
VQIFISYSHNEADAEIARFVAEGLKQAGYDVWLDLSAQPAGEDLEANIEEAILHSDCAIFIVSKLWLQSRWSRLELDRFDKRGPSVRRVPVFRLPYDQLKLPMELITLKGVTWLDDDPHHDARLWEVYCAVGDQPPGPAETWADRGEQIQKGQVRPPVARASKPSMESLRCNRAPQWNRITDVTPESSHDVLFVPGAVGQAHDHFSRRVRELLRPVPPRGIVTITWRKRPAGHEEFLAALADALEIHPADLSREMAERMSDSNLVVIHPCVRAHFADPALVRYYTEWLPALLNDVKPRMRLKSLQPVEWPAEKGALRNALTWLRFAPAVTDEGKREAQDFMAAIMNGATPAMRSLRLQELSDITQADLEEFCDLEQLTPPQRRWFLARIQARNPDTSEAILASIDAFLADARSVA